MKEIRYIHAINNAIKEEMENDEDVVFIGEDIGISGGAFGAARGLFKQFGSKRKSTCYINCLPVGILSYCFVSER